MGNRAQAGYRDQIRENMVRWMMDDIYIKPWSSLLCGWLFGDLSFCLHRLELLQLASVLCSASASFMADESKSR